MEQNGESNFLEDDIMLLVEEIEARQQRLSSQPRSLGHCCSERGGAE